MKTATIALHPQDADDSARTPDFNRLAPFYRWMEWFSFGPFLWKCRCAFLPEIADKQSALILGDGDGRFTARLLHSNPHITVDAIDASDAMLRQLTHRAQRNSDRLRTGLADARRLSLPAAASFDLVVTHFFLDCLATCDVEILAMKIRSRLAPGAAWIVSEFAIPENLYGKFLAAPLVSALYFAFACLTGLSIRRLPDHRHALRQAGLLLSGERTWLGGLLVSEMWTPSPALPSIESDR
jgi:ubiquinone/menaquinone biosynthesis C-methylase UbiE